MGLFLCVLFCRIHILREGRENEKMLNVKSEGRRENDGRKERETKVDEDGRIGGVGMKIARMGGKAKESNGYARKGWPLISNRKMDIRVGGI